VEIVTQTAGDDDWEGLRVHRGIGALALRQLVADADLYIQNNISLRYLWPVWGCKAKITVLHQTYLWPWNEKIALAGRIKQAVVSRLCNLSISRAVAKNLPVGTPVTGNPYDAAVFRLLPEIDRDRDIIFVGRLVSDKGIDVLFDALKILKSRGLKSRGYVRLTVVGQGPEEDRLRAKAGEIDVSFLGVLQGEELARALNQHQILVIPSLWPEPFGVVALEGAACGCQVIGSEQGGLREAIGPCGLTFPNGDPQALADRIDSMLDQPHTPDSIEVTKHLRGHAPAAFASRILELAVNQSGKL
jgi:glycosyltransferase involved in cell wall biosynthesis